MIEPISAAIAAVGGVGRARHLYHESKWCRCGHKHARLDPKRNRVHRQQRCAERGCNCADFRSKVTGTEFKAAKAYGTLKKRGRQGGRFLGL